MSKGKAKLLDSDSVFICLDDDETDDIDLEAAFKASFKPKEVAPIINIDDDDEDDEVGLVSAKKKPRFQGKDFDLNPGPLGKLFWCELCDNSKPMYQSLKIKGCTDAYCCNCIGIYVSSKLDSGKCDITCPADGCWGTLDPEYCKDFLSKEIYDRWGNQLCESVILSDQRFYCPFKDCAVLLIKDGEEQLSMIECPHCNRLFCAICTDVWHEGVSCGEYRLLKEREEDDGGVTLRCPHCALNVAKVHGCSSVCCRNCRRSFTCGTEPLRG